MWIDVEGIVRALKHIEKARGLDTPDEAFEEAYKLFWVGNPDELACECEECREADLKMKVLEGLNDKS